MALRTPEEYKESIRDGRNLYYRGQRVEDPTEHPALKLAVDHACIDFAMSHDPEYRDLATVFDPDIGERISRYYSVPRSSEDLLKRSELTQVGTRLGDGLLLWTRSVPSDGLVALSIMARKIDAAKETGYGERVEQYRRHCAMNDLALSAAMTDARGDRGLGPGEQEHPDYYVRVVRETSEGIVVRGAKAQTTSTTHTNEIVVMPTRALKEGEKEYAVSFAVPVNAKGITLIASPYFSEGLNDFEHPISGRHKQTETLTVFEDVFVPWDRVFLNGEWEFTGPLVQTFANYDRFSYCCSTITKLDLMVGAAFLIADYNGIMKASHVRDKLVWLISYAETMKALTKMAALDCVIDESGVAMGSPLITNVAELHYKSGFHQAVSHLQNLAGGLLVTGPGKEDLESPDTREYILKYLGGRKGTDTEERLRVMNLIRDLTASDYGGYIQVSAVHGAGSIEPGKMAIRGNYDPSEAMGLARRVARID